MLTAPVGARAYHWTTSLAFAELRVLRAIARHAPTSDIAETLRVTSNTVRAHLRKLLTPTVPEYATLTEHLSTWIIEREKNLEAASIILEQAMDTWGVNSAEMSAKLTAEYRKAPDARRREAETKGKRTDD